MTDRYKGLVVTLDHDMREDDAKSLIAAISLLHGVASVHPSVSNAEDYINREQIMCKLRKKLYEVLTQHGNRQTD